MARRQRKLAIPDAAPVIDRLGAPLISADLIGKTVLVTGGASGIGLAAVEIFSENGARVAVNHLPDDAGAERVVARLQEERRDIVAAPGDVSVPGQAEAMVERAVSALGRLNVLINNAGTAVAAAPLPFDDLEAMDEDFWSVILNTNLLGPFRCSKAASPHLVEAGGCIVNTASIAGLGIPGSSIAYGASKAALINLTKSLARGLGPLVRVNAVAPGQVRTPWTEKWPESRRKSSIENSLLKRPVDARDIGYAMLFLATNASITGETLVVDCGRTM